MTQKHTISSKQILAGDTEQLQLLLRFLDVDRGHKKERMLNGGQTMSAGQLHEVLDTLQKSDLDEEQALINAIEWAGCDQQWVLSDDQYCWLSFLDTLYLRFIQSANLDISMFRLLMKLRVCFVRQAFIHPSLIQEQHHPLRQLLEQILNSAVSWNQTLGKSGEVFFEHASDIVRQLCSSSVLSLDFIVEQQQRWQAASNKELQRVARLEQRLFDTESGQIRARRAQQLVLEMINCRLAGRHVPAVFAQFCLGSWKDELRLFLIRHGVDSEEWQRGQKLLETLAKSFQLPASEEERQRVYNIIPRLGNELVRHVSEVAEHPEKYQSVIEAIEATHIEMLKGHALDRVEIEPQPIPDMVAGVTTHVSADLRKKVLALDEGQWLCYREEGGKELRCKLLAKIPDTDQLLFVNRNGLKVLQKGVDDLAYCLSAGIAHPLPQHCNFEKAYQDLVKSILSDYELRQNDIRELQNQQAEENRQRSVQEADQLKARLKEQEARAAAAAKAKSEAQALARAKEAAQQEAEEAQRQEQITQELEAQREQEQKDQELARFARLSLDSLTIGAWVEIPNRDGVKTTCKLAVKVNSSRKFIFVDRNGLKVGELIRDELVALILAGDAKILNQGDHFEKRLAKVVSSLRRDKS